MSSGTLLGKLRANRSTPIHTIFVTKPLPALFPPLNRFLNFLGEKERAKLNLVHHHFTSFLPCCDFGRGGGGGGQAPGAEITTSFCL